MNYYRLSEQRKYLVEGKVDAQTFVDDCNKSLAQDHTKKLSEHRGLWGIITSSVQSLLKKADESYQITPTKSEEKVNNLKGALEKFKALKQPTESHENTMQPLANQNDQQPHQ